MSLSWEPTCSSTWSSCCRSSRYYNNTGIDKTLVMSMIQAWLIMAEVIRCDLKAHRDTTATKSDTISHRPFPSNQLSDQNRMVAPSPTYHLVKTLEKAFVSLSTLIGSTDQQRLASVCYSQSHLICKAWSNSIGSKTPP
jgi:hypothetical protein